MSVNYKVGAGFTRWAPGSGSFEKYILDPDKERLEYVKQLEELLVQVMIKMAQMYWFVHKEFGGRF